LLADHKRQALPVQQQGAVIKVNLSAQDPDPIAPVLVLEMARIQNVGG